MTDEATGVCPRYLPDGCGRRRGLESGWLAPNSVILCGALGVGVLCFLTVGRVKAAWSVRYSFINVSLFTAMSCFTLLIPIMLLLRMCTPISVFVTRFSTSISSVFLS